MANQYAIQDQNAQFALIGHSGTAGTAETIRLLATEAGALQVDLVGGDTINIGTVNLGTITRVGNVGTIESGTVTAVLNTGTITTIAAGTQNTLGTVGVVNAIIAGTQNTLGTVGVVNAIVAGTQNTLGTVGVVNNIVGGTVQLNETPVVQALSLGTLGTAGGSFFATVSAASGAGTKHYVSGVDIVVQSGTADVRVLAGTSIQGTGVLAAGFFSPSGGITKRFNPVFATGTNSELIYHFVGAGTAFITVSYWKGV